MFGYLLKFAGATFEAVRAVYRMTGQKQFQGGASQPQGHCPLGINDHPLCHRSSAGCNRLILAFNLHETQTARGERFAPFPDGTKVGDVDAIIQSCPQDLLPWGSSYFLTVNRQRNLLNFCQYPLPYSLLKAENILGQESRSPPVILSFRRAPAPCRSWYQHLSF